MSTRLRFSAAAQVFEAFPTAADDIETPPSGEAPLDFLRKLLAQANRFDAIAFAAYLLPRREAVCGAANACARSEATAPPFSPPRLGCATQKIPRGARLWIFGSPAPSETPPYGSPWPPPIQAAISPRRAFRRGRRRRI
jgi:hypothetical protein